MNIDGLSILFTCIILIACSQIIIIYFMRKILRVLQSFQQPPEEGPADKPHIDNLSFRDIK